MRTQQDRDNLLQRIDQARRADTNLKGHPQRGEAAGMPPQQATDRQRAADTDGGRRKCITKN